MVRGNLISSCSPDRISPPLLKHFTPNQSGRGNKAKLILYTRQPPQLLETHLQHEAPPGLLLGVWGHWVKSRRAGHQPAGGGRREGARNPRDLPAQLPSATRQEDEGPQGHVQWVKGPGCGVTATHIPAGKTASAAHPSLCRARLLRRQRPRPPGGITAHIRA